MIYPTSMGGCGDQGQESYYNPNQNQKVNALF